MDTRFYRLSKSSSAIGTARLANLIVSRGQSVAILSRDDAHSEMISNAIWSVAEFLPHSVGEVDGLSKVNISTNDPKGDILLVIDDAKIPEDTGFERVCLVFHAADSDIVNARREDWKSFSNKGIEISYWAENETGAWEKKAEANTEPKT